MNSPKISFNKNSQAWAFIYFSEAFEFLNNKAISRVDLNYQEGSVKCIHYGDILTKFPQILDSSSQLLPYINDDVDVENISTLKTGDIVIADTAEDYAVGKSIEVCITDDSKVIAGLHTMSCRPKKNFASGFLGYYINSTAYHGQLRRLVTGTKVYAINKSEIRKTNLHFPCVEEQQKIAAFFTALDEKIFNTKQKLDCLTSIKRKLLKDLISFTTRFRNEKGEVFQEPEITKLEDLCAVFKSGNGITSDYINQEDEYPVYGGNGVRGFTSTYTHDGLFVLIGRQGALCGNVRLISGKNYVSEHAIAVQANHSNSTEWIRYLLEAMNLNSLSESSAQPGLSAKKLKELTVCVPCLDEQLKIAEFLTNIELKINIYSKKKEVLMRLKHAFMQQMFV